MTPLRFLVVDDEPEIRMLVRMNVRGWGQECRMAASAAEARLILEREPVDVLLVDLAMPEVEGEAFVRELSEAGDLPPHVFLMSALPPEMVEVKAAGLGIGWISKPFTAREFRSKIGATVEGVNG